MRPDAVERVADHRDLAVHHAAGPHDVGAGGGLGARHLGVHLEGGVVVDRSAGGEDAAVAVVGELVEAQVGHHRQRVAHLGGDVGDRDVEDARRGRRHRCPSASLVVGHAEEHDPAEAGLGRLGRGPLQRVARVLHDARHAADRHRLGGALADEHRQHQLARGQAGLGDQVAQRRRTPQPARPDHRPLDHSLRPGLAAARRTPLRGLGDRLAGVEQRRAGGRRRSRPAPRPAPPPTGSAPARRPAGRAPPRSSRWPGRSRR